MAILVLITTATAPLCSPLPITRQTIRQQLPNMHIQAHPRSTTLDTSKMFIHPVLHPHETCHIHHCQLCLLPHLVIHSIPKHTGIANPSLSNSNSKPTIVTQQTTRSTQRTNLLLKLGLGLRTWLARQAQPLPRSPVHRLLITFPHRPISLTQTLLTSHITALWPVLVFLVTETLVPISTATATLYSHCKRWYKLTRKVPICAVSTTTAQQFLYRLKPTPNNTRLTRLVAWNPRQPIPHTTTSTRIDSARRPRPTIRTSLLNH